MESPSNDTNDANETLSSPVLFFGDTQKSIIISAGKSGTLSINKQGIWFTNKKGENVLSLDLSTVKEIRQGYSRIVFKTVEEQYFLVTLKRPFPPIIVSFPALSHFTTVVFIPFTNDVFASKRTLDAMEQQQKLWSEKFHQYGYLARHWEFLNARSLQRFQITFASIWIVFAVFGLGCVLSGFLIMSPFMKAMPSDPHKTSQTTQSSIVFPEPPTSPTTTVSPDPDRSTVGGKIVPSTDYVISDKGDKTVRLSAYPLSHGENGTMVREVTYWSEIKNISSRVINFHITISCTGNLGDTQEHTDELYNSEPGSTNDFGAKIYLHPDTQSVDCAIVRVAG